jgi:hypothetical protein
MGLPARRRAKIALARLLAVSEAGADLVRTLVFKKPLDKPGAPDVKASR